MTSTEERVTASDLMTKNIQAYKRGEINPLFKNLPKISYDETHPGYLSATGLSSSLLHLQTKETREDDIHESNQQSSEEVAELVIVAAGATGAMYTEAHVEDLRSLSSSMGGLSIRDVTMYLRGVTRTNQTSLMTKFSKLLSELEVVVKSVNTTQQMSADSINVVSSKLAKLTHTTEGIIPSVTGAIRSEHAITRSQIEGLRGKGKEHSVESPKASTTIVTPKQTASGGSTEIKEEKKNVPPLTPSIDEIMKVCELAGCPMKYRAAIAKKGEGKITWNEYNNALNGTMTAKAIKDMVNGWNAKA